MSEGMPNSRDFRLKRDAQITKANAQGEMKQLESSVSPILKKVQRGEILTEDEQDLKDRWDLLKDSIKESNKILRIS